MASLAAECERRMDVGEIPWVLAPEGRIMVQPCVMDDLALVPGQRVNATVAHAIRCQNIAALARATASH